MELFAPNKLREKVRSWRKKGYPCEYPVIQEIFDFLVTTSESNEQTLVYLRKAQFEALETYWYLRIVEKTPHIFELYKRLYTDPVSLLNALGINLPNEDYIRLLSVGGLDAIFDKIKTDSDFAKKNKLETVKESLTLSYPSYILALAMGAGKTVLIGAIIATEFAMALEYSGLFVRNALVFAPGKTILGALKEISDIPFEKVLPPRIYKQFISTIKITYTQDNEKDIPIINGSYFNIIVTNTEKIRIQKPTRKNQLNLLNYKQVEKIEQDEATANLRLQTVASLPNLAIFSDEAHHTYGQSLDRELKKVRKTVDYLAKNTNVIVVVNTTGTPYYNKQMLRDVVYWYGLSEGIKDGILKEVKDSIYSYENITSENFLNTVLDDFFKNYGNVKLFNGALSKIAIYFPQTEDLRKFKPVVQRKISEIGLEPSIVLEVHNKSDENIKDLFNNRINDTKNPFRVFLLVNMGTEGWNCPSLFATALARKLKSSNNFVLQSASRCLRQVPNNVKKARIYLSKDNVKVLDSQLKETFGESLQTLDMTKQEIKVQKLILKKFEIDPIVLRKKIQRVIRIEDEKTEFNLQKPNLAENIAKKIIYDVREQPESNSLLAQRNVEKVDVYDEYLDINEVAVEFSSVYRLELKNIFNSLKQVYPHGLIDSKDILDLRQQIEKQIRNYKIVEEEIELSLALVKTNGFSEEQIDGKRVFVTEIIYHREKADLLLRQEDLMKLNQRDFGFHYSPYNMDSYPEKDFFLKLLEKIDENPDEIEDIYYTGAITDSRKTDFLFQYKDNNGKWRSYTPDFVLRKTNGKILIVEIKAEKFREQPKEVAMKKIESMNPNKIRYEILFTNDKEIGFENLHKVEQWIYEELS